MPEILCNENIVVVGANGKYRSEWNLREFAHRFPFTEVVKISPLSNCKLIVFVYDATAKALAEKRYEDVLKYADILETHTFNDDIGYIESYNKLRSDVQSKKMRKEIKKKREEMFKENGSFNIVKNPIKKLKQHINKGIDSFFGRFSPDVSALLVMLAIFCFFLFMDVLLISL